MEGIRLFLLKIILSAIVLNIIIDKNVEAYNTITKTDKKYPDRSIHRRNWPLKSSNSEVYKNMPPYLVFNRKTGSYYPYFKFPGDNNVKRMGHKSHQWKD